MTKQELKDQNKKLEQQIKKNEKKIAELEYEEIKKKIGKGFGCENCKYGCAKKSSRYFDSCVNNMDMKNGFCKKYSEDNKLSKYIRNHYSDCYGAYDCIDVLNDLLCGTFNIDLLDKEELFDKVIRILDIVLEE